MRRKLSSEQVVNVYPVASRDQKPLELSEALMPRTSRNTVHDTKQPDHHKAGLNFVSRGSSFNLAFNSGTKSTKAISKRIQLPSLDPAFRLQPAQLLHQPSPERKVRKDFSTPGQQSTKLLEKGKSATNLGSPKLSLPSLTTTILPPLVLHTLNQQPLPSNPQSATFRKNSLHFPDDSPQRTRELDGRLAGPSRSSVSVYSTLHQQRPSVVLAELDDSGQQRIHQKMIKFKPNNPSIEEKMVESSKRSVVEPESLPNGALYSPGSLDTSSRKHQDFDAGAYPFSKQAKRKGSNFNVLGEKSTARNILEENKKRVHQQSTAGKRLTIASSTEQKPAQLLIAHSNSANELSNASFELHQSHKRLELKPVKMQVLEEPERQTPRSSGSLSEELSSKQQASPAKRGFREQLEEVDFMDDSNGRSSIDQSHASFYHEDYLAPKESPSLAAKRRDSSRKPSRTPADPLSQESSFKFIEVSRDGN